MLEINPEIVCNIILKAREFHAQEQVVIPDEPGRGGGGDDWALQVLADHSEDMTLLELRGVVDDLEPDQQQALVALMWMGRGDYTVEEWDEAIQEASDRASGHPAEYLLATPLVADYLDEGLAMLGYNCENV